MIQVLAVLFSVFLAFEVHAATLIWDGANLGPITIERGTSPTGPFTTIATVPDGTTQYILTPGSWGHYRVRNTVGPSNTVQYSADLYGGGLTDRLDALDALVTSLRTTVQDVSASNMNQDTILIEAVRRIEAIEALELGLPSVPPSPPPSTFTITHIDSTHIRIVCNGVGITTLGSGTSRTMECRQ